MTAIYISLCLVWFGVMLLKRSPPTPPLGR